MTKQTKQIMIIVGPILVIAIWILLTSFKIIKPIFLPPIWDVAVKLYELFATGEILKDLGATVMRWLLGLLLGILVGVPVGMFMGYSDKVYKSLEIVIDFFRSIPGMVLLPLFLVFFGLGNTPKIALAAWGVMLYTLVSGMYGVKHSRETRMKVAKTLGANSYQTFTKFIFPDALPEIAGGIRIGISLSLALVVVSEMVMGTKAGLGKMVYDASLIYNMSEVYAVIIITGLLGYISNKLFLLVETKGIHWAGK